MHLIFVGAGNMNGKVRNMCVFRYLEQLFPIEKFGFHFRDSSALKSQRLKWQPFLLITVIFIVKDLPLKKTPLY